MAEQSYLIAADVTADLAAIKDQIKQDEAFTHWWNHLPAVFLVTSRLTADQITDRLSPVVGDARFLVIGVRLDDTEGWLPEKSWRWIKHRERDVASSSTPYSAAAAD